jgi:DNA invertase Pin-like site-specific DNA recombinase
MGNGEPFMKEIRRAAIYLRCSTAEQETDMQETELREYRDRRGWSYTVYRDKGQSGLEKNAGLWGSIWFR